ncbi:MAG: HYR domain-containing protein, partial [Acidobacteriota bacterium]
LNLSGDFTAEATSPSGSHVSFGGTATDTADGTLSVTCTPSSPATLPEGVNTIHCSATDRAGNVATGTITITVRDTSPPILTVPSNIVASATTANGAAVIFNATATDTADGTDPVSCIPSSGSNFLIGATTVNCSAQDKGGNVSTGSFTITVVPHVLTVTANNASRTYGVANPAFTYNVTGFAYGDSASVITGVPSFSTPAVGTSPEGTYPITVAHGTLTAPGYTFQFVSGTLTVTGQSTQSITFAKIPNLPVGTTMTLSARSTSGLPVSYTFTGPATMAANKLTVTGTGSISVTASQSGNANYLAATPVTQSFTSH